MILILFIDLEKLIVLPMLCVLLSGRYTFASFCSRKKYRIPLPYSVSEVGNVVAKCKVCSELRPNFHKPQMAHVIKATQPFERLSLDFKGPLPTSSKNRYLLTIIDEYSGFPFGFACPNVNAKTIIFCLNQVFVMFGMPACIHSDRGTAFISQKLLRYLRKRGVACSRTSVCNALSNGQCECYNGII